MATNGTEVYIKLPSGRNTRYDISPHQRLGEICCLVAEEERVQKHQVRLKYQGKTLDNSKTVKEYGIRVETILRAEILIPQDLSIVVELDNAECTEVDITNLESVSSLYEVVAAKIDIPASKLQIKVAGRVLASSSNSLMDAGIAQGTKITATELTVKDIHVTKSAQEPVLEATKQKILSSFNASGRNVEVAFSFDTTGSMYQYLDEVRQKLRDCCTRLIQDIPNIRISIIAHGDYCDSESIYAVRLIDFTSDIQRLTDFAQNVDATGGGDSPECYELVLKMAQQLDWSEDSAKALVVIGDYYPHPPSYTDQHIQWRDELELLVGMEVKVYGVQAGSCSTSAYFYEELAEVSDGCYLGLGHLSLITDMFLAVCYNEAGEDMLGNFQNELTEAGQMTDQKEAMFTQLRQKTAEQKAATSKTNKLKRSLNQSWWDSALDHGQPQYVYKRETDKWLPANRTMYNCSSIVHAVDTTPSASVLVSSRSSIWRRLHLKKRKCCIM